MLFGFRRNYYLSTPLCEDNDKEYSYHGYGQSDVYKIDPYGTNDDYVRLAAALHKKTWLVMDYVTNHWGIKSLINDLPLRLD
jgi:glycosidase